jgi:hypothetical protein
MRTSQEKALLQDASLELLGFKSASRPDRQARVKRSVRAKVGEKPPPPPTTSLIDE